MKTTFAPFSIPATGTLILPMASPNKLSAQAQRINKKCGNAISRVIAAEDFKAKKGETLLLRAPAGSRLNAIVLVGLGDAKAITAASLAQAGGAARAALPKHETQVALVAESAGEHDAATVTAGLVFGLQLRSYRFEKYFTKKDQKKTALKSLTLLGAPAETKKHLAAYQQLANGVSLARDLVTEPPNHLYPETFAARVQELSAVGLKVEVLDEKKLKALGMGALLGVAQGSVRPARVAIMQWQGNAASKQVQAALVGKGVTFDTGGISLKPADGMWDMKYDMGGAAAVVGAMHAIAANQLPINVIGAIGLVENMPDGNAQRPGDVVTTMSGQTVEVLNTDAEGRLVLADVLWYVQEKYQPEKIVDLATLTGAMVVALGSEYAGMFANNDELANALFAAGQTTDEPVWRFPLGDAYDKMLQSDCADMKNISTGRGAGSITAAQFLQRFIKKGVAWAHLDIAGMAWARADKPTVPAGASGYGVRLLYQFAEQLSR